MADLLPDRRPRLKLRQRLYGILRQRCPRCCRGKVFARRLTMHEYCSVCGLHYGRESGYFLGAMDVSYLLAVPLLFLLCLLASLVTGVWGAWSLAIALPFHLMFVPVLYRCSRVMWMHLDRAVDPD